MGIQKGKSAIAVGYGAMSEIIDTTIDGDVRAGDLQFDLHAYVGEIRDRFPDNSINRRSLVPGACFSTNMNFPGGMSGSPIFDDEGIYVHGIVSSSARDESGSGSIGYGTMVQEILTVPIELLEGMTLLEANRDARFGMPKMSIAGA